MPMLSEGCPIRPVKRTHSYRHRSGNPLPRAPYQAPAAARSLLHIVVVAMMAGAILGTHALTSTEGDTAPLSGGLVAQPTVVATGQASQASAEGQSLEPALQPSSAKSGDLLLAVLSLEASTTTAEVEASMQRIVELAAPQPAEQTVALESPLPADEHVPDEVFEEDADEEPTPEAADETACRETGSPAFCVYTVAEGDTLSGIAQALGFTGNESVSAAEMLAQSNKPDVVSSDHIEPGQNIRVPYETGILHIVFAAESAAQLSEDYGTSLESILASPYNSLAADGTLVIGQEVFIPDPTSLPVNEDVELELEEPVTDPTLEPETEATPEPDEPAQEPTATDTTEEPPTEPEPTQAVEEPTSTPEVVVPPDVPLLGPYETPTPTPTPEPTREPTATPEPEDGTEDEDAPPTPTRSPSGSGFFIWPVEGPISSYFGPSHPLGIDIDLYDNPNAPIVASRAGTVVFAGGDACCSYGYYVIIEHENGIRTLYAHLSRISVSVGEEVSQGDVIGRGGRTGYATGNHLHFEIRVDGNVVDPLRYLP